MAQDLALDFVTRDLKIAPNMDLDRATGQALIDQRIRVRLIVPQGEWLYDPTGGSLGSRLRDALRLPLFRAQEEIPLLVHEALDPMDDIDVTNVTAESDEDDSRSLVMTIYYRILDDSGQTVDDTVFATSVVLQG